MSSNKVGSFYFFAYGTYVDPVELKRALSAESGAAQADILRSHPALLPGYRLTCDAVSAEGPRLGRLNLAPYNLVPRDPVAARPAHPGKHKMEGPPPFIAAFRDGVRGMLYELPANMRTPLLRAVAKEGSFNVYAMLMCHELNDVRHGVRDVDAPTHEALVIAAMDLPAMERKYHVASTMLLHWMSLPPPEGVIPPPGLSSSSVSTRQSEASKGDTATATTLGSRWPGLHWCNCICSNRVAPSCAYAAAIEKAYREQLLLQTAAEEEAEGVEKGKSTAWHDNPDDKKAVNGDTASYGQTVYRMVYQRARDVLQDPPETKTWYLAYGSNLSWEQVCVRIGPPYQRRAVKLCGYVLVANKVPADPASTFGYYNVEPVEVREEKAAQGIVKHASTMPNYVCGAAYEIAQGQLELMDEYEWGYVRELHRCTDLRDSTAAPMDCWTYIAKETSEELMPSQEYKARVLEGADILPLEYMEGIRATPSNPLRSPRQDRRLRKEL